MAGEIFGVALWPGAESCVSCTYTISHGISPGAAVLTINPQATFPAVSGDLVFDDGQGIRITIPRCKVDKASARVDGAGEVWDVVILDRRWQWRELGQISGTYNQVDTFGKTLPWTARTPYQLAELCLQAMGERGYTIILPNVTVLPPVQWDHVPPAQALEALVTSLGCRLVYRLDTDSILITPQGVGSGLPDGSIQSDGPVLDTPERPDKLVVYGQPVRFQARFMLQAVGEDWDQSVRPINELSYAPDVPAVATAATYRVTPSSVVSGNVFQIVLEDEIQGKTFAYTATVGTVSSVTAGLVVAINLAAAGGWPWHAVDNTTSLDITGPADGSPFKVTTATDVGIGTGTPKLKWEVSQLGRQAGLDPWAYACPPTFSAVKATDRLTKIQATELAKRCIYRMYRVRAVDPSDETQPLRIPQYNDPIVRREQIVLHQTRAEQILPQPQDDRVLDDQGRPRIIVFYDGHSRDMPSRVIGAYSHGTSGIGINTRADSDVAIPFSIDPERGIVTFSQYVAYSPAWGKIAPAKLTLETGCNVRDFTTNALIVYEGSQQFAAPLFGTPPLYVHREDVQYTVIGEYDTTHRLTGAHELLPAVPIGGRPAIPFPPTAKQKIQYYLAAYARQFENVTAQDKLYNGLLPIWLDGAIQQVTWIVGEQGCETRASTNSEHSKYVPPYPVRKRNDILDPVAKGRMGANFGIGNPFQALWKPPPRQDGSLRDL